MATDMFNKITSALINSRATDWTMRHAAGITFYGYTLGNGGLFIKDLVQTGHLATWDTAAGASFLVCSTATLFSQKHPVAAFRTIGGFCLLGSAFLGLSALNIGSDIGINEPKMIGAAAQAAAGLFWGLQKEIADYAAKVKDKTKNLFNKAVVGIARYPVAIAAAVDLTAGSGLLTGAIVQPDPGMQLAMIPWYIGIAAMTLTDPRIQSAYANSKKALHYDCK